MIQITMSFANLDEATAFLAARTSAPKAATGKPVSASTAASKPTAEAAPADAPSTKELDFEKDVVPALRAYSAAKGNDALKALLTKHSATRVPELAKKPETWVDIIKTCAA